MNKLNDVVKLTLHNFEPSTNTMSVFVWICSTELYLELPKLASSATVLMNKNCYCKAARRNKRAMTKNIWPRKHETVLTFSLRKR